MNSINLLYIDMFCGGVGMPIGVEDAVRSCR